MNVLKTKTAATRPLPPVKTRWEVTRAHVSLDMKDILHSSAKVRFSE